MIGNLGGAHALQRYQQARKKLVEECPAQADGGRYLAERLTLSDRVQIDSSSYLEDHSGTIFVNGSSSEGGRWQETFVETTDVPGLLLMLFGEGPRQTLYHFARSRDDEGAHSLFEEFNLTTGETLMAVTDAQAEARMAAIRDGRGYTNW